MWIISPYLEHSIDAEAELAALLSKHVAAEIEREKYVAANKRLKLATILLRIKIIKNHCV